MGKSDAMRLARTETSYFQNRSTIEGYKEMGFDELEFIATLDMRTSEICREHDHKIVKVKEAEIGYNVPPLHPYCRSTVAPWFGKEFAAEERIARHPETGANYYVSGNTDYKTWRKTIDRIVARNGRSVTVATSVSRKNAKAKSFTVPIEPPREELRVFYNPMHAEEMLTAEGYEFLTHARRNEVTMELYAEKDGETYIIKQEDSKNLVKLKTDSHGQFKIEKSGNEKFLIIPESSKLYNEKYANEWPFARLYKIERTSQKQYNADRMERILENISLKRLPSYWGKAIQNAKPVQPKLAEVGEVEELIKNLEQIVKNSSKTAGEALKNGDPHNSGYLANMSFRAGVEQKLGGLPLSTVANRLKLSELSLDTSGGRVWHHTGNNFNKTTYISGTEIDSLISSTRRVIEAVKTGKEVSETDLAESYFAYKAKDNVLMRYVQKRYGLNPVVEPAVENTKRTISETPNAARIVKQRGAVLNRNEQRVLEWARDNLTGTITVLRKSEVEGVKTPDLSINGVKYDIKTTSGSLGTLDYHIRKAASQTGGGGAIVDITGAKYTDKDAISTIDSRMRRSGLSDAVIIRDGKLVRQIRNARVKNQ